MGIIFDIILRNVMAYHKHVFVYCMYTFPFLTLQRGEKERFRVTESDIQLL